MSTAEGLTKELEFSRKLFRTTTSVFEPADAGFAPEPELYTVAGHIAHTADSIDWFIEGAFGEGWDLDFEELVARARAVTQLDEATHWLERAFANAIEVVKGTPEEDFFAPIPDTRIMEGAPRISALWGLVDHTAHHRGSLAVYARLIGKAPPMLYS